MGKFILILVSLFYWRAFMACSHNAPRIMEQLEEYRHHFREWVPWVYSDAVICILDRVNLPVLSLNDNVIIHHTPPQDCIHWQTALCSLALYPLWWVKMPPINNITINLPPRKNAYTPRPWGIYGIFIKIKLWVPSAEIIRVIIDAFKINCSCHNRASVDRIPLCSPRKCFWSYKMASSSSFRGIIARTLPEGSTLSHMAPPSVYKSHPGVQPCEQHVICSSRGESTCSISPSSSLLSKQGVDRDMELFQGFPLLRATV